MNFVVTYSFDNVSMDLPVFNLLVYDLVARLPRGFATAYGEIAKAFGDVIAARAVARMLARNPYPDIIPCYKVVASDGDIGGYTPGGPDAKVRKLIEEGIKISEGKVPNEFLLRADKLDAEPYLASLRRFQETLARKVRLIDPPNPPDVVGGLDVAYVELPLLDIGIGSLVAYSLSERRVLWARICVLPILFPYIPTYLAYRELPIMLFCLFGGENGALDAVLVDGHGLLHPRKFGIACHLGVLSGMTSIGVAKSLLAGRVSKVVRSNPRVEAVEINGETLGYSVAKGSRRIYVSPGNLITLRGALELILSLPWPSGNTVLPIYLAHRLVSRTRKKVLNFIPKLLDPA